MAGNTRSQLSHLQTIVEQNAGAERLSALSGAGITDLAPFLPVLSRFSRLRHLDLSSNRLQALPEDIGRYLAQVEELDLGQNPTSDVHALLKGLKSLPSLRRLHVNLPSQTDEDHIIVNIEELTHLNGQPLDAEDEEEEGGEEVGEPEGTAAERMPEAAVEHAPEAAAPAPAPMGHQPPQPHPQQQQPQQPASAASGAERARLEAADLPPPEAAREVAMTESDLEGAALLFGALKTLRVQDTTRAAVERGATPSQAADAVAAAGLDDPTMTGLFDHHIEDVMGQLRGRLDGLREPFLRQGAILHAKADLFDVVTAQAVEHGSAVAGREFGTVLRKVRKVRNELLGELAQVLSDMRGYYQDRLVTVRSALEEAQAGRTAAEETVERQQQELSQRQQAGAGVQQSLADAQARARRLAQERDEAKAAEAEALGRVELANAEAARLQQRLEAVQAEKQALEEAVSRQAGSRQAGSQAALAAQRGDADLPQRSRARDRPARNGAGDHADAPRRGSAGSGAGASASPSGGGGGGVSMRHLSLKQLHEQIAAIYVSKIAFDDKCLRNKLPRETMEQHMYTHLNQKYGLKSLIIEYASAIIRAVGKYQSLDNDVKVFGRILRNEVEEEFRFVQEKLKKTVQDLLKEYLRAANPLKAEAAIDGMVAAKQRAFVLQPEWRSIVSYMYSPEDSGALISLILNTIKENPASTTPASPQAALQHATRREQAAKRAMGEGRRAARRRGVADGASTLAPEGAISYPVLLKTMLDFQLRGHERYLKAFRKEFKAVDSDANGIVDEHEFRQLVQAVAEEEVPEDDVEDLLQQLDPHENQHITFSQCVTSLADLIRDGTARRAAAAAQRHADE